MIENVVQLNKIGVVEKELAKAIISCQVDDSMYGMAVGRNLNFFAEDKSSVFNSPNVEKYLKRCLSKKDETGLQEFVSGKKLLPLITHESLPNIDIFFELYPRIKVVECIRNPIDLIFSWFNRGWGRRWGTDPKEFSISIKGKKGAVPWFAFGWEQEYENIGEMDRVIASIGKLTEMSDKAYAELAEKNKNKIHFISYERLLIQPEKEIGKIASFLGRNTNQFLEAIKKSEQLPKQHPQEKRQEKISFIKKNSTEKYFETAMKTGKEYENKLKKS